MQTLAQTNLQLVLTRAAIAAVAYKMGGRFIIKGKTLNAVIEKFGDISKVQLFALPQANGDLGFELPPNARPNILTPGNNGPEIGIWKGRFNGQEAPPAGPA